MAVVRKPGARYVVAAGGLAQTPLRLAAVEALLAEDAAASIEALTAAVGRSPLSSLGEPFGSLAYKVHVGAVLLSRILATLNTEEGPHAGH